MNTIKILKWIGWMAIIILGWMIISHWLVPVTYLEYARKGTSFSEQTHLIRLISVFVWIVIGKKIIK